MAVRPRRKPNHVRFFALFIGLIVVGVGAVYGIHWAANPWALALPGKPALTGYWQGVVPYGPGDERRIVLHLADDQPSATDRCGDCPDLQGAFKVCHGPEVERYEVWGDPSNYLGTRFSLHTRPDVERSGPRLNEFDGDWDADLLRIRTSLTTFAADGVLAGSGSPTASFEMTRAGEADFDDPSCG
ncbi:hypothetical protein [Micromonospora sp. NPDC051006]|uniref:hypothetical protein n=1 Tax=Micromonospora sp. NPDC051006 TaxID=3364283 RepID=UPI0037B58A90